MGLDVEQLVVLVSFVLPGFVALHVYDMVLTPRTRSPFESTIWSLLLSIGGAAVASLWLPPLTLAHLFQPEMLGTDALWGTAGQLVSSVALAGGLAFLIKYALQGRLGTRSAYPSAWDVLWSEIGGQSRWISVDTGAAQLFGLLHTADDPRIGRAMVIRSPRIWSVPRRAFVPYGAEFCYIPGSSIIRVDVSAAPVLTQEVHHDEDGQSEGEARPGNETAAGMD